MPDGCVHCCVTSPPYYGLRDYGAEGQLGLEKTPEEYVSKMVSVFAEVRRVLKDDGTLWLNLGDSYAGSGGNHKEDSSNPGLSKSFKRMGDVNRAKDRSTDKWSYSNCKASGSLKPKDLVGIPWLTAFALRNDGWYLRSDIIWSKPNPMPESVTDRPTKAHEYIFLLSKNANYYYDNEAVKEDSKWSSDPRMGYGRLHYRGKREGKDGTGQENFVKITEKRNKRSVWEVSTKPYKHAHFATFPPALITPCILAGCPEGGIVLDPFMGSGTVAITARKHARNYCGIELNPKYIELIDKRMAQEYLF